VARRRAAATLILTLIRAISLGPYDIGLRALYRGGTDV
jgi:hypothetical protein